MALSGRRETTILSPPSAPPAYSPSTLPVIGTHQLSGRRGAGPVPGSRWCGFRLPRCREVSSLREPGQVCEAARLQQWTARAARRERRRSQLYFRELRQPVEVPRNDEPGRAWQPPGRDRSPVCVCVPRPRPADESTAAGAERLPAFANWMAVVWRPRSPLLSPLGASARPRGGGAVRSKIRRRHCAPPCYRAARARRRH